MIAVSVGSASGAGAQAVLDTLTLFATKTEERAIDALAGVSVVRQEQMDQIGPKRTSDLFWGLPSVWFDQRGDSPETSINIRGLQDFGRVAVVVDGARQNFQRSGHNASGTFFLEPELLSGLDVIRGPVANIYGSGAIGGVASFRTKDVEDVLKPGERWGALANTMAGSNQGQGLGSLFGAARIGPNVDVFAGGTYRRQTDYQDGNGVEVPNSGSEVATGIGKVTVRPAEGHELKLGAIHYDSWYKTGQRIVGAESVYDTNVTNNIVTGRWRYQKPEDNLFDFDGNVYWTTTDQKQTKVQNGSAGLGNPITGFVGDARSFSIDTKGFDLHNTSRAVTGDVRHAFTYGGDFFRDRVENVDPTGAGDVTTPSGERSVSGGFVQWKGNYSTWLEAIAAVRYDTYRLDGGGVSSSGDHVSPKGTLGLTPFNGFTVYGTYAEGYRAPAVTETLVAGAHPPFAVGFPNLFTFLPNPNLRPEVGKTKEVGVNLKYDSIFTPGDKFRGKVNLFRNDVEDYIELVNFGPPVRFCPALPFPGCPPVPLITINPTSLAQYQNIGDVRIEGVEFEGTYDAGTWFVGLSGQHIRGQERLARHNLGTLQPDQIAATFGVRLIDRKLTLAVRWLGVDEKPAHRIPDRNDDGIPDFLPTDAYGIVNLYLGYQPTPDILAGLSIDNVFNEYYVPYLNSAPNGFVFPGPGVTYKASLKIRFGVL